jgi:uncharacterized protein DUF4038/uncharacterized protein DUF5060/collagenase-like protein with putative collagen-binding domain
MSQLTAPSNHLIEIKFQSSKRYQNPFFDINLDVTFTEPNGKQLITPAFWAGDNQWIVRYSSATSGTHQYITLCNDIKNRGLHHIQGTVVVTPYKGDNLLLRHGAPKVASDKRHFSYGDNTPFFWLGDTWWLGLTKRLSWPNDFQSLAKDRQDKGFTVVQLVAGLYPDMAAFDPRGASLSGFPWEENFTTINPAFFDEADIRIMHLVNIGICPCVLGTWGYYLQWLGTEKMKLHWRYVMARWGALPVIWTASGEQIMPWYLSEQKETDRPWLKQEWTKVIRYMHEINGFNRMITTHPQKSARSCVDDPSLLDFEMQQTNHRSPTFLQAEQATKGWHTQPEMPVISGESRYEALEIIPKVTTTDARQAFWAHLLNSGCAGHTYGANGIWQVNKENDPFGKSPNGHNWGTTPWHQAMHLPGSSQLAHAKALLLTLPWYLLKPILPQPVSKWKKYIQLVPFLKRHQEPIAAAATADGELAIYYLLNLKPILINMQRFSHPVDAFWFDPTNGNISPIANTNLSSHNHHKFKPIGKNGANEKDWVLVIKKQIS